MLSNEIMNPAIALEAKKLQAAGYAVMGVQVGWDVAKAKKCVHFKNAWQTTTPGECLHSMFRPEDTGLALVTGEKSDVLAVDLDVLKPKDVEQGLGDAVEAVERLIQEHGLHPAVPIAHTPTGGRHLLFKLSTSLEAGLKSAQNATKCANLTIDVRADRGCIICHPTNIPYPEGSKQYLWMQPVIPAVDLQPAPSWLIHLLNQRTSATGTSIHPPAKRQRLDATRDLARPVQDELFTCTVRDQMTKIAPQQTIKTIWAREGGIDFRMNDMTCSCPLCGHTHVSNNYRARVIIDDAFVLGNYSTSCRSQVFGWQACRLINNLIASPVTDDPHCNILKAVYQLQNRTIVFTAAKRFLSFNGIVWESLNPQYVKQDIKMLSEQVIRPLTSNIPKNEENAPKLRALVAARKYIEKAHSVSSVLQTFETLSFDGDIEEELDLNPDLLAVGNGVIDLPTGSLMPGRASHMLATAIDTKYRDGPTPLIDAFFDSIFNDDQDTISYMRRLLGYGITGHTREQVWAIWTGVGSNGKSLLMELVKKLLGQFCVMMPGELLFETGKTAAGASTPHLQTLIKKRLGFKDEGKTEKANVLNDELIKTVTGSSTITSKALYKEFTEFQPTHLPVLLCNKRPHVNIHDEAMMRRIVIVPFTNVYTSPDAKSNPYDASNPNHRLKDDKIGEKLMSKEGQQQLLAWLVRGAKEWYATGLGKMSSKIGQAFDSFREENDLLGAFIAESCTVDAHTFVNAAAFLQAYNASSGVPAIKQKAMKELMAKRGFKQSTGNGRVYKGVSLIDTD